MGRMTPLGNFILLIFFLLVGGGILAATDNLRWPPFGITLPGATTTPQVVVGVTATAGPAGASTTTAGLVASASVAPATNSPRPVATATPAPPTLTPTPAPPTATPTPLGLAYSGPLEGPPGRQPALLDPETHRLFVVSADAAGRAVLIVYDTTNGQKSGEVDLGLDGLDLESTVPVPVLLHQPTHKIYVVGRNGRVATLDSTTLVPGPFGNFAAPVEVAVINPDGNKLYGLLREQAGGPGPQLRVIDLRTGGVRLLRVPSRWSGDAAFADGSTLYLTGRDGLLPLDMRNDRFGTPVLLGFQPLFPYFEPSARRLYVWRQPQSVPLLPELLVLDAAAAWQQSAKLTREGCPCVVAVAPARNRLYLAVPTSPGQVLAYTLGSSLGTPEVLVLNSVPALALLADQANPRLYVQSRGPHPILVVQDNGPGTPGRGPVVVEIK